MHDAILSRTRTVMATLAFVMLAGAFAYAVIPKEQEPDLDTPFVGIDLALEGVSPPDAERLLVRPLEEQLRDLEEVDEIRAVAFAGGARITLALGAGTNAEQAIQDVRTKTDMARVEMPADMEEPRIYEADAGWRPLLAVAVFGDVEQRVRQRLARDLRDAIRQVPGVLRVDVTGAQEELVEFVVDPVKIQSYRLNNADLGQVFTRANRLIAAGRIDTGKGSFAVSVPGLFENVSDVLDLPVKTERGSLVRVRDIGEVRRTFKDAEAFVRVNGQPAIALEVKKRAGANLLETGDAVKAVVARMAADWPRALKAEIILDGTKNMRGQFLTLQNSVILAIFLVMVVVVAAMGVRSGLLVGVAIPGSFLLAILALYAYGLTLNIAVMFGLIIAVGILVDAAIVIVEYADRKMVEGLDRRAAFGLAARRMTWPTVSSTATTIAAFSPVLFWPGISGELMSYIPMTLIFVLIASLAMALVFVPALGALFGRPSSEPKPGLKALGAGERLDLKSIGGVTGAYIRVLTAALKRPALVLCMTLVMLVGAGGLYAVAGSGVKFFPWTEPVRLMVLVRAPGNLAVEERDRLLRAVEQRLGDGSDFANVYTRTRTAADRDAEDVIGKIALGLKDWDERRDAKVILADLAQRMRDIPGVRVELEEDNSNPFRQKPVQLELSSVYSGVLDEAVAEVRRGMDAIGGFINVEDSRPIPKIEWTLDVDRVNAARFGADIGTIGNAVRLVTNGLKLGTYRPDDSEDEIDIVVRFPESARTLDALDGLRVQTQRGLVPISNFVARRPVQPATQIERVDGRRVMSVASGVAPGRLPADQVAALKAWLADNPVSPLVRVAFRGEQEEAQEAQSFLGFAFGIALFLMAAILLIQFNSFYAVAIVLSSVIFSTIGVLLGYVITAQPFILLMSGLGLIALAGIVVNNNIVLIDTFDRLKAGAASVEEAILQTGAQRLRPVMLTTITTCLGLLPMACMMTIDFLARDVTIGAPATRWWQQLAVTIIFGLSFATVLTLIVTPCALVLPSRLKAWAARRFGRSEPAATVPAEEPVRLRAAE